MIYNSLVQATSTKGLGFRRRTSSYRSSSGVDGGVVVEKMRTGTGNFGFDAATRKYVDLVEAGIIDPT